MEFDLISSIREIFIITCHAVPALFIFSVILSWKNYYDECKRYPECVGCENFPLCIDTGNEYWLHCYKKGKKKLKLYPYPPLGAPGTWK